MIITLTCWVRDGVLDRQRRETARNRNLAVVPGTATRLGVVHTILVANNLESHNTKIIILLTRHKHNICYCSSTDNLLDTESLSCIV